MRIKIHCLLFLAIISLSSFHVLANATDSTPDNYCRDEASWFEWHSLLEKHPDDNSIIYLYALRRGLCSMVESGNLEVDRATDIFEKARQSVMDDINEKSLGKDSRKKQAL
ncbi:hypothetical protein [Desulfogranum marinum]|uniref:hypothetical protein n=1 Tax=Desulfogranum marinum TaxID=453220 RepID=UPI0029C8D28B|nr:hypothetical protein [Desulfogranum marinum]